MSDRPQPAGLKPSTMPPARGGRVTNIGLTDAARDQATGYIERRKSEMARFIAELARALRGGAGRLDAGPDVASPAKPFVDGLAGSLDALAESIDERGVGELYRDVAGAARRHPEMALLVAIAAGFGALHLVRTSTSAPATAANRSRL